MNNPARVVFARDTRASGSRLVGVLNAALTATDVEFIDFKYMTTPQLHYVVRCKNTLGTQYEYGEPSEQGYYQKLVESFKKVMRGVKVQGSLTVDCANGVGGPKLRELMKALDTPLEIKVINDDVINPDSLNFEVNHTHSYNMAQYIDLPFLVWCRLRKDQATCPSLLQGRCS